MLCIDKPFGWTSFDVVKKLRGILSLRKIGHAGTLDPLATGLLLLCVGEETKDIPYYQALPKTYQAMITLGYTTPSYDAETLPEPQADAMHLSLAEIRAVIKGFEGTHHQLPPIFSSIKINGTRAYRLARSAAVVAMPLRQVVIHNIFLHTIALPHVYCTIKCSKGTYIRSLAHDIGASLRVGGYLSFLRRTAIGNFSVRAAYTPACLAAVPPHKRQHSEANQHTRTP